MDINVFETRLGQDLHQYFLDKGKLDERMPECPDVEELWTAVGNAYLPDGAREFNKFPTVALGWIFYVGMAAARYWDTEWEVYSKVDNLYTYLRDKRGFDRMDDFIAEDVLLLTGDDRLELQALVGDCAERVYKILRHEPVEPGTKEAFQVFVACLHQMYLMGMAVELHSLGYRMTRM
jgi:hypothetical protein